jgi:hypothetical protein
MRRVCEEGGWLLESDGEIVVTLPEQVREESATLEPLLAAV